MNPLLKFVKLFLVWRAALLIPVILGSFFLSYGSSYPFFEVGYYKNLPVYFDNPLFKTWFNFDGVHYLDIATQGYISEARFFPLLSIIIFLASLGNLYFPFTFFVGLILPNIFFLGAIFVLYKLLKLDYSDKVSSDSILYLLVFPTSFFFASVYSESLFLLLFLGCFYFARKGNWLGAIYLGTLLCSTRFVGIFIIPALIYEYIIQAKTFKIHNYLAVAGIIFITPLSLAAFAIYNFNTWGNYLYFLTAHAQLGNSRSAASLIFPGQTLYRYLKILTTIPVDKFEWWIAVIEVAAFIFGTAMLFLAWKKKVRISYLIFAGLCFLLPVLSGTFSGLPRYCLIIFPIFIALALVKSRAVKVIYLFTASLLLFLLLMFFTKGYFIA